MPTFRHPVLVYRDAAGGHHALALDHGAVGFGATRAEAKADLGEYLVRDHRRRPWVGAPDFLDPEVRWQHVAVRPEYRTGDRLHPAVTAIDLRVLVVVAVLASGQPAADLPLLDIQFDYPAAKELPDLVRRYALHKLEGLTPEELAGFLPPTTVELDVIPVRVPSTAAVVAGTPETLARVAEPVGDRAVKQGFARAWGREVEVAALVRTLHDEKASVLLVGEPGVGKSTLLVDAAKQAEKRSGTGRRFWLTSAGRLVAGMKYLGQWEERVERVIAELGEVGGVLCVDRLLDLIRRGGFGPSDSIAAFLMPYLSRGEVRIATEATPTELDACRRLLPGLADLFRVVPVRSFEPAEALAVLDQRLVAAASGPGIQVARGTGEQIVRLFRRFQPYAPFPGPASGFARELVTGAIRAGTKEVGPDDAVTRFRARTGLPDLLLRDEVTLDRADVLAWFRDRVVDQPEACAAAADVVTAIKAGVTDPARPPAVLLFCGPTGVGKTELAKAQAEYLYGHGEDAGKRPGEVPRLVRLDMSEYGGFDAAARLIGPPHGEPGELIRRVRKEPFCVLLLDEIEKASPEVFDTLMGVFDEGRLTDQYGRVTDFRGAVIVMTSNLGASRAKAAGFGTDAGSNYSRAVTAFFRPEFFNRLDAVVTFDPLGPDAVRRIARRELASVAKREGLASIRFEWTERLIDYLAAVGFDARYGARPLQRAVEREVVAPLARWLVTNSERPNRIVVVDRMDDATVVHTR